MIKDSLGGTKNLASLLQGAPPTAIQMIQDAILYYMAEYNRILKKVGPASAAYSMHGHLDQHIAQAIKGEPVTCKKGCSNCCHILVSCTGHEGQLIVEWCKEKGVPIDWDLVDRRKDMLRVEDWEKQEDRRCVFLKDDECSIYEVRPMNCRSYMVVSPPRKCNSYKTAKVAQFVDTKVEAIMSAVYNITGEIVMSKALLLHTR